MMTYFPSQTRSNSMIVIFAQNFWFWSEKPLIIVHLTRQFLWSDTFECWNIECFWSMAGVTNILVVRDNILHRKRIYLQKTQSSIFKYNALVARDNILHRKRIFLQKTQSSIFKYNVKVFRNNPKKQTTKSYKCFKQLKCSNTPRCFRIFFSITFLYYVMYYFRRCVFLINFYFLRITVFT